MFLLFSFVETKKVYFWNEKKCFLFHFETSFPSWDIQILEF